MRFTNFTKFFFTGRLHGAFWVAFSCPTNRFRAVLGNICQFFLLNKAIGERVGGPPSINSDLLRPMRAANSNSSLYLPSDLATTFLITPQAIYQIILAISDIILLDTNLSLDTGNEILTSPANNLVNPIPECISRAALRSLLPRERDSCSCSSRGPCCPCAGT
jgi:hypothetical protein